MQGEHTTKTCEHMDGKILIKEAAELKMTPMGHIKPRDLGNEEPYTTMSGVTVGAQATKPRVRLHTTGHHCSFSVAASTETWQQQW